MNNRAFLTSHATFDLLGSSMDFDSLLSLNKSLEDTVWCLRIFWQLKLGLPVSVSQCRIIKSEVGDHLRLFALIRLETDFVKRYLENNLFCLLV